jgi:hypothetical protein
MDTFATILRYGFLVALLVEALLVGRAFFAMLREKARAAAPAQPAPDAAAAEE